MSKNLELFSSKKSETSPGEGVRPLAELLRPTSWEQFQGIDAFDKNLLAMLRAGKGRPPSLILWGPPGTGKTTLAKLIGHSFDCKFVEFSAVLGGVKDVREIVDEAKRTLAESGTFTILFTDEIHRFNKAQQDAFLPHVENGTIVLIGATTENPSFSLTSALLSRVRVVVLPSLRENALLEILAAAGKEKGLEFSPEAARILVTFAGGDARRLINLIEVFHAAFGALVKDGAVDEPLIKTFLHDAGTPFYDRSGEEHYNMISAFIKSMRGSDPDASLYWAFRMLEGGEDPRFIIRRLMIFASEDVGNADPRALQLAVATSEAYEKIGLPEGRIPIAQCITYLASAPKSNRSYAAMHAAIAAIGRDQKVEIPLHLRNAPTKLMKELGYGKEYEYPHDWDDAVVPGVTYLPEPVAGARFYEPSDRGYEKTIRERLEFLRAKKG